MKEWLGNRYQLDEIPLPGGSKTPVLPSQAAMFDSKPHEFVASKVFEDGSGPWGGKKKCIRMLYAAIEGHGLPRIHLQTELEKLADWRVTGARCPIRAR